MRGLFSFIVLFVALFVFGDIAVACTCVEGSLAKRFRKAEAIFIGRLADYENEKTENIQNYKEGLWILEVKKSFKGVSRDLIAIGLDVTNMSGSCSSLTQLEDGFDYLIFAYGKDLKIRAECSDSRAIRAEYDWTIKEISRLDSFWFRTRARLWPF